MKRIVDPWEAELETCRAGQKLLQSQRFQWPADWLWIDVIEGEWASFKQILQKRIKQMDDQIPALKDKIRLESNSVDAKIKEIERQWMDERPQNAS